MTHRMLVIAAGFIFLAPSVAADVVHLRNGNAIEADSVTEEGDVVYYERHGGRIGVDKREVLRIERVAKPQPPPGTIIVPSGAVREAPAPAPSGGSCAALKAQLAEIEREQAELRERIAAQEAQAAAYRGGLVKAMATTTLETMRQTAALLEQRRARVKERLASCTTAP